MLQVTQPIFFYLFKICWFFDIKIGEMICVFEYFLNISSTSNNTEIILIIVIISVTIIMI